MDEKVLLIEPVPKFAKLFDRHIRELAPGVEVVVVPGIEEAYRDYLNAKVPFTLAIGDYDALNLDGAHPPLSGGRPPFDAKRFPPIVVLGDPSDERRAVASIRRGATDYFPKRGLTRRELRAVLGYRKSTGRISSVTGVGAAAGRGESHGLPGFLQGQTAGLPVLGVAGLGPIRAREMPRVVGEYRVLRPLGTGAIAATYLAYSDALTQEVVLKVIWRQEGSSESLETFKRFEREFAIVSQCNSLEIVDLLGFGKTDRFAYIAMEYFPGGDLRKRMQNPISPSEAVAYATCILRGLAIIHPRGVFHRDIKPANVMLREDNSLALIDFGAAKSGSASTALTGTNEIFGTPFYISPEQILGEEVDGRADLYATAATLFEMLTGRPPYIGRNVHLILEQHVSAPVPTLPPALSGFQAVIDKGLAKERAERFANADDFITALQNVTTMVTVSAAGWT